MNISLTRGLTFVLGAILLIAGVFFAVDAMRETDWVKGLFALAGIVVGFALLIGKGVTVSQ